jgi:uncharacterized membrane protein
VTIAITATNLVGRSANGSLVLNSLKPPTRLRAVPSLRTATVWLGWFLAIAYVAIGIAGVIWPGHWDEASATDQILWGVFLISGTVLLVAGLRLLDRAPGRAAVLLSVGAVVGALPIFWTLLPLVLALVLIVLSIRYARRDAPAA